MLSRNSLKGRSFTLAESFESQSNGISDLVNLYDNSKPMPNQIPRTLKPSSKQCCKNSYLLERQYVGKCRCSCHSRAQNCSLKALLSFVNMIFLLLLRFRESDHQTLPWHCKKQRERANQKILLPLLQVMFQKTRSYMKSTILCRTGR